MHANCQIYPDYSCQFLRNSPMTKWCMAHEAIALAFTDYQGTLAPNSWMCLPTLLESVNLISSLTFKNVIFIKGYIQLFDITHFMIPWRFSEINNTNHDVFTAVYP